MTHRFENHREPGEFGEGVTIRGRRKTPRYERLGWLVVLIILGVVIWLI